MDALQQEFANFRANTRIVKKTYHTDEPSTDYYVQVQCQDAFCIWHTIWEQGCDYADTDTRAAIDKAADKVNETITKAV